MATTKQTCGLICEYNPFHFGHAYQIEKLKERFDTVVCILGGNVSQRGEAAVSDRYLRARAAHTLIESNKNSSVLDIALSCGFESLNTFYRAYRRVFGKTPLKNDNF